MLKQILQRRLRDDSFLSGQMLAQELGVSRAAIAKAVNALRKDGFEIQAVPNRGYRLIRKPDLLRLEEIQAALQQHPWAETVHVLPSVDSTNRLLRQYAANGAPEGTVIIAEQQCAGRGRMGRDFFSPPGVGIYLSVLLRPSCPPGALMTLTAQAALAVAQAIERVCGVCPGIKWVNDLQLNEKKISGTLTELSVEAESGIVNYAIVGVGVNCNQQEDDFPEALRQIASSIRAQSGKIVDRNALAAEMIRQLSALPQLDWYEAYCQRCTTIDRAITIHEAGKLRHAYAVSVGRQAELLVQYADGSKGVVRSGEVSVRTEQAEE